MSVPVESDGSTIRFGAPVRLFEAPIVAGMPCERSYPVSGDGQRFLVTTASPETFSPIQVIVNWTASLGRRMSDDVERSAPLEDL
jgi:hypothetical protein